MLSNGGVNLGTVQVNVLMQDLGYNDLILFSQKYKFGGFIGGLLIHPAHNESIILIKKNPTKGINILSEINILLLTELYFSLYI